MKKRASLIAICILAVCGTVLLAGCGANLDREITLQKMLFKVPSTWLEFPSEGNNESSGTISYEDVDEKKDNDKTVDMIVVRYQKLTSYAAEDELAIKTAQEAILTKQKNIEKEQGISDWSIDKEKLKVIDGAQITTYKYSFVKEIDGVKQKYEYDTAYVFTSDMMYEISAYGDKADINSIVDSLEF